MSFTRIAGLGGLLFAVTVFVGNLYLAGAAKPIGNPPLTEIVAYYAAHGPAASLMAYVAPIAWFSVALFAAGVLVDTRGSDGRSNGWALMGASGIAMMVPTFCGVVTADLVLASRADTLAATPQYTQMLWDFHMVLEILNLTFVAIAMAGLGMAAVSSGRAPRLGKSAVAGAVLLLAAATQSVSTFLGSTSVLVALPGFLIWLVFVASYSAMMVRSTERVTVAP